MASVFLGPVGVNDALLAAGRELAFGNKQNPDAMERLLRKVHVAAQFRAFRGFLNGAANDEEGSP